MMSYLTIVGYLTICISNCIFYKVALITFPKCSSGIKFPFLNEGSDGEYKVLLKMLINPSPTPKRTKLASRTKSGQAPKSFLLNK